MPAISLACPVIDLAATGANIRRLRQQQGLSVRDLQSFFGFEEPRAIYKWQSGQTLPSVDNLYALSAVLQVPMERILVCAGDSPPVEHSERQAAACRPLFLPFCPAAPGEAATVWASSDHFAWGQVPCRRENSILCIGPFQRRKCRRGRRCWRWRRASVRYGGVGDGAESAARQEWRWEAVSEQIGFCPDLIRN